MTLTLSQIAHKIANFDLIQIACYLPFGALASFIASAVCFVKGNESKGIDYLFLALFLLGIFVWAAFVAG